MYYVFIEHKCINTEHRILKPEKKCNLEKLYNYKSSKAKFNRFSEDSCTVKKKVWAILHSASISRALKS